MKGIENVHFSGGGDGTNNLKKVEAYVAISIIPGSHLVEESVKDGLHGFRNIVCWRSGDLNLTNNPLVKRFWFGTVESDEEELEDDRQANLKGQTKAHSDRRLSDPGRPHFPSVTPHSCHFASCKENQPQEASGSRALSLERPHKKVKRSRAAKRPLEELEEDPLQAESLWTDREILEWF